MLYLYVPHHLLDCRGSFIAVSAYEDKLVIFPVAQTPGGSFLDDVCQLYIQIIKKKTKRKSHLPNLYTDFIL